MFLLPVGMFLKRSRTEDDFKEIMQDVLIDPGLLRAVAEIFALRLRYASEMSVPNHLP